MTLLLSEILQTVPNFAVFDELIKIPTSETNLQPHDFLKINKVIDDIGLYLKELQVIFHQLHEAQMASLGEVNWYYEGKHEVNELHVNINSIDSIISRLLMVMDAPDNAKHLQFNHLLTKFEQTSDLLLEVKKWLILFKKKVDISINYQELHDITMTSLNKEIEDCLKIFFKLQDIKLLSPDTHSKFNLPDIISKMKINSISNNFTMKSINLPTFNDLDESLYHEYLTLENKLQPLKVSIEFLPLRIQEFISICSFNSYAGVTQKSLFPTTVQDINHQYQTLVSKWEYLLTELKKFKMESIDSKWDEVFIYLIDEIIKITDHLIHEFITNPNKRITKKIGDNYKICINSITIMKSGVKEDIITGSTVINSFNSLLLPKWNQLNDILTQHKRSDDIMEMHPEFNNGLRAFQTRKRNVSKVTTSPIKHPNNEPAGLGIDLGMEIEDSQFPLSIQNTNKIKDVQQEFMIPKSRNLLQEFKLTNKEEDEETLVAKTPGDQPEPKIDHSHRQHITNEEEMVKKFNKLNIHELRVPPRGFKSKIPKLIPNYLHKSTKPFRFPKGCKIPRIDKSHPRFRVSNLFTSPHQLNSLNLNSLNRDINPTNVNSQFNSPNNDHSNSQTHKNDQLFSPISFQRPRSSSRPRSPTPRSQYGDDLEFKRLGVKPHSRSRTSSKSFLSPVNLGMTPQLGNTPNLSYPQSSPSYGSTSPDRPTSSIGSRYDDEHLLQPLKHIKPAWR